MTDLAFLDTADKELSLFEGHPFETFTGKCAVNMVPGTPVYLDTNGLLAIADANGAGTDKYRGIVMYKAYAGQPVSVLRRGTVCNYDLTSIAFDAPIYVSNTAGKLGDAAGSTSLLVARVVAIPDYESVKKALHFSSGFVG